MATAVSAERLKCIKRPKIRRDPPLLTRGPACRDGYSQDGSLQRLIWFLCHGIQH